MVVHVNNSLSGRCFFLASQLTIVSLDTNTLVLNVTVSRVRNLLLRLMVNVNLVSLVNCEWIDNSLCTKSSMIIIV